MSILAVGLLSSHRIGLADTSPVGYQRYVFSGGADTPLVTTMTQTPAYRGIVNSVDGGIVDLSGNVDFDVLLANSGLHYLQVVDGDLAGFYTTVTNTTDTGIVLEENAQALGLTENTAVLIIPFWTLDDVFPNGEGLHISASVFAPESLVLFADTENAGINLSSSAAFFYHDGSQLAEGWYQNGNISPEPLPGIALAPDNYVLVRHPIGSDDTDLILEGRVSVAPFGTIVQRISANQAQDNAIGLGIPVSIQLGDIDISPGPAFDPSTNVFAPVDRLLVFSTNPDSINNTAAAVYFFHDGSQLSEGWYKEGAVDEGVVDSTELPAGSQLLVRRAIGEVGAERLTISPSYLESLVSE